MGSFVQCFQLLEYEHVIYGLCGIYSYFLGILCSSFPKTLCVKYAAFLCLRFVAFQELHKKNPTLFIDTVFFSNSKLSSTTSTCSSSWEKQYQSTCGQKAENEPETKMFSWKTERAKSRVAGSRALALELVLKLIFVVSIVCCKRVCVFCRLIF